MSQPLIEEQDPPKPNGQQPSGPALRSAILSRKDLKEEPLFVPEWGCWVTIREMRADVRADLMAVTQLPDGSRDGKKFYPMLTIASCFDPATDQPIFQPSDPDELNTQGGTAMERVCVVAVRLSGLNPAAFAEAKKA